MTGRMPISRDVSIKGDVHPHPKEEDASPVGSKAAPGLVTVIGFDRKDVLFRSDQVGAVQWRDANGEIVALLVRLKPDIWGFSRRGEEDWAQVLEQYGSPDLS